MKSFYNKLFQAVAVATNTFNLVGGVIPVKIQIPLAIGISVAQAVVSALAHYYNPDGSKTQVGN